jgi:hypothetical protein
MLSIPINCSTGTNHTEDPSSRLTWEGDDPLATE